MTEKRKNMKKVPNLRFPGFGEEWSKLTLGEIAKFSKGKGISKSDIDENGITQCIRYGELYTHYKEIITEIKSKTNIDSSNLVLSEANDIIIPSSGETQIDIATASCVLESGVALGGDLNIIKTPNNGIFLCYYLSSKKKREIANLAQGVSVVHLYSSQLASLRIFLPSLNEQAKVASFLSLLSDRIQTQSKIIEGLKLLKASLIKKIFSQQLRFKDSDDNSYSDWELKMGKEVFKNISNKNHNSDLPILAITQEYGAIPRELIDYNITVTNKSIDSYKVVEIGDFIISLRSFQGGIEYSAYKGICSPAYIILRPVLFINGSFYKYYLKTKNYIVDLNRKLEGIRDGKMISYKYFSEIQLPFPIMEEQAKIADFFSALDNKIEIEIDLLQKLQNQKKFLLQNLFI